MHTFSSAWKWSAGCLHGSPCHELGAAVRQWSGILARHETEAAHSSRLKTAKVGAFLLLQLGTGITG